MDNLGFSWRYGFIGSNCVRVCDLIEISNNWTLWFNYRPRKGGARPETLVSCLHKLLSVVTLNCLYTISDILALFCDFWLVL